MQKEKKTQQHGTKELKQRRQTNKDDLIILISTQRQASTSIVFLSQPTQKKGKNTKSVLFMAYQELTQNERKDNQNERKDMCTDTRTRTTRSVSAVAQPAQKKAKTQHVFYGSLGADTVYNIELGQFRMNEKTCAQARDHAYTVEPLSSGLLISNDSLCISSLSTSSGSP